MNLTEPLLERGLLPDRLVREGIRRRCAERLQSLRSGTVEERHRREQRLIAGLCEGPVALHTDKANEQHYELPPEFLRACLGPRMKYSSGYWPNTVSTLSEAEDAMLDLYVERAQIVDGQDILELGCGWGSLTLYLAESFPRARIVGVSNSAPQRNWILAQASERGLSSIEILTADVNELQLDQTFDRVVSVEMFEHMKNYEHLLARVAGWLRPEGSLFVHMFTQREWSYHFEVTSERDWMARYFFTGGTMAAHHLLLDFQQDLIADRHWKLDGTHYQRTANAWLNNLDASRDKVWPLLERSYGVDEAKTWWARWRVFFMACAEMFGYDDGQEWLVSHYRFTKR